MSLQHFIAQFGYLAAFIGAFLEGETAVVMAGFAAHRGYLHIGWVFVVASAAAFLSDQLYFFIGRRYGPRVLERKPNWKARSARIRRYIKERGTWFLFSFRFMYGIRTISPFMIGMSEVRAGRFALINATSAIVWGVTFSLVGFLVGAAAKQFIGRMKQYEGYFFAGFLVVGAIIWLVRHFVLAAAPTDDEAPPDDAGDHDSK